MKDKAVRDLQVWTAARVYGHRAEIGELAAALGISRRTCIRKVKRLAKKGWVGTDGKFMFPRSARRLGMTKRGGLPLEIPTQSIPIEIKEKERLEALCFTFLLKKAQRSNVRSHPKKRRAQPPTLPTKYFLKALKISERRFKRLKSSSQRFGFLICTRQFNRVGSKREILQLRKNLPGMPLFVRGEDVVTPMISRTEILI